jgi:hypothetical protein
MHCRHVERDRCRKAENRLSPTLALPIAGKADFVGPPEQLAHPRSLRGRFTHVLAIGWRGSEAHVLAELETLSAPECHLRIVTGGQNADTLAAVLARSLGGHCVGFGPWINSTSPYDFLGVPPPRR